MKIALKTFELAFQNMVKIPFAGRLIFVRKFIELKNQISFQDNALLKLLLLTVESK